MSSVIEALPREGVLEDLMSTREIGLANIRSVDMFVFVAVF